MLLLSLYIRLYQKSSFLQTFTVKTFLLMKKKKSNYWNFWEINVTIELFLIYKFWDEQISKYPPDSKCGSKPSFNMNMSCVCKTVPRIIQPLQHFPIMGDIPQVLGINPSFIPKKRQKTENLGSRGCIFVRVLPLDSARSIRQNNVSMQAVTVYKMWHKALTEAPIQIWDQSPKIV